MSHIDKTSQLTRALLEYVDLGLTKQEIVTISDAARFHDVGKVCIPDHLKEIKNWVQIVSLADVYTALRAKRIYKPAYSKEEALEIIKKGLCL